MILGGVYSPITHREAGIDLNSDLEGDPGWQDEYDLDHYYPDVDPLPLLPGSEGGELFPGGLSLREVEGWLSLAPRVEELRWDPGCRGRRGIKIKSDAAEGRGPEARLDLRWDARHRVVELRVVVLGPGGRGVRVVLDRGTLVQVVRYLITAGREKGWLA